MAKRQVSTTVSILIGLGLAFGLGGCAAGEPSAVLQVGSRNLRCPRGDLETAIHRESNQVREYYVGCDFMFTRVLCDKIAGACHPAKARPPCFGGGCFKENPETFEWELDQTLAQADAASVDELFSSP
jgi:hypothetical protein